MATLEQGVLNTNRNRDLGTRRSGPLRGVAVVVLALVTAGLSFVVLTGLTPIQPSQRVTLVAIVVNGIIVAALLGLIGLEAWRIIEARRTRKAASRLHVRIVGLFSLVAAIPALIVAIVAAITLDRGLDRWFDIRTRTIVASSLDVAESYLNENAINLRDATINMAFALDSQRILFDLDRNGFRQVLTQQARGRGMLGASVVRPDGSVIFSADIATDRPLPLPPSDALEAAADGGPVIIPPGVTNLVGAMIQLRDIDNALLYTVRTVDPDVLAAVRLMEQNRLEYQSLDSNQGTVQLAFAILYFGLTLILLLSAIWTGIAVADRIVRPIRQLINASDEVGRGNLDVRVPVRGSDGDVGHLGETFNAMLGQLKSQRDEIIRAKDQIDERRRFSEAVLSGVSAGVLGVDDTGRVTVANASAARVLDRPGGIKGGMDLRDVEPHVHGVLTEALESGRREFRKQVSFTGRSGRERVLSVQVNLDTGKLTGQHRTHVVTVDDISDLVDAQRSSAWADIARRIAHEIKNPLTPIQLSAERIRRRYGSRIGEDREVFDQCTDTIIRQVGDIGRMVDEFSAFARMPKPVMAIKDLREVIREAAFLVEVARSEIRFERDLPDEKMPVLLDDRLAGQAIGNIVKNASEAIEARIVEGIRPDEAGHILVRAYRAGQGENVHVDVIDNGRGLPRSNRSKLLEPYMTTREKGTGLGLAIVRKIMEDHGGALELHDAPAEFHGGTGAMIRLVFPAAVPAVEARPVPERPQAPPAEVNDES